jgi:hypothetical protein
MVMGIVNEMCKRLMACREGLGIPNITLGEGTREPVIAENGEH